MKINWVAVKEVGGMQAKQKELFLVFSIFLWGPVGTRVFLGRKQVGGSLFGAPNMDFLVTDARKYLAVLPFRPKCKPCM